MRHSNVIRLLIAAVVVCGACVCGACIIFKGHTAADAYPRYHALMDAIDRNDLAAVKSQIKNGTNPNDFPPMNNDEDDIAPLCAAVSGKQLGMVKLLLHCGTQIEVIDGWNQTPLGIASSDNNIPMMKLLISHGAKVNDQLDGGSSPLWNAATSNSLSAVQLLLTHGANPNTKEHTDIPNDPLLSVVNGFHYAAVADLLKKAGAK